MNDHLTWACWYASHGLSVLPLHWPDSGRCSCNRPDCTSPGKHPLARHGKDDATTDLDAVRAWWQRWPDANIGIRPPVGIAVLDVDPRNGGAVSLARLPALPATLTARTGGGGWHHWFGYAGRCRGRLGAGLDVKTHTGYVVAPPSLHTSGQRYGWTCEQPSAPAPGWLRDLLDPPSRPRLPGGRSGAAGLVRAVEQAPEGNRNNALHWAACRAHQEGLDVFDALTDAAVAAGLVLADVQATIASAGRMAGR